MTSLNPYEKPPEHLKVLFKKYQRLSLAELNADTEIVDFLHPRTLEIQKNVRIIRSIDSSRIHAQFSKFTRQNSIDSTSAASPIAFYERDDMPGLYLIPSLLPSNVQQDLLSKLLHRDLAEKRHKSNVHAHYHIPYELCEPRTTGSIPSDKLDHSETERSFFNCAPSSGDSFEPKFPEQQRPMTVKQFLCKKLRWITFGGQYDWTRKAYPDEVPPPFPPDIAELIHGLFPSMRPEAAIVNVYSPGDTLSMHRDVSEDSDAGLVSVSLGCDALFLVGVAPQPDQIPRSLVVRLRSGDAVYMDGSARYAWHGVPQIVAGTCPKWLESWPARGRQPEVEGESETTTASTRYDAWHGWISDKRINLNVRQMLA